MGERAPGGTSDVLAFDIERDLLCTADANGYFVSLNAAWERVLGWSREELMGRPFAEFVHPDDLERTTRETEKVAHPDSHIVNFENRYRTKDGDWRWLRWNARSDGETWFAVATDVTARKESEARLRTAIGDGRLLCYSQPIVEQRSGQVAQEELLVRLSRELGDEGNGPITAAEFLPELERFGLIGLVDRSMVSRAVELVSRGRRAEVNLSSSSLEDGELIGELETALSAVGRGAENLVFEITESAAIEHLDAAREVVERLTRLGCRFALDDFGTGFGSLSYLRHVPVHFLKIDTSFVCELHRHADDRALVRGVIEIGRELGLETVAEGVEQEEALELLREYGVDYVQGYLIGRPAPLANGSLSLS